jgi:UDP-MurNAc hydroxylase
MSENANSVELLSHASVLISCGPLRIICDPWFLGSAFNGGWALHPEPDLIELKKKLSDVGYLWISHEHPDHLHFESLKEIRSSLPEGVTVLFQRTNSDKVFEALRKIGYSRFRSIQHMEVVGLAHEVKVSVYCHRHLDSALLVMPNRENWLLNINDTELNEHDMRIITKTFGEFSVLLNQFSIAGSDGIDSNLEADASNVLVKMISHHQGLGAKVTIPFASFMRFSQADNQRLNKYTSSVFDAKAAFSNSGLDLLILKPQGGPAKWDDGKKSFSNDKEIRESGEAYFQDFYKTSGHEQATFVQGDFNKFVEISELSSVVQSRISTWKNLTSSLIFRMLKPIHVKILDHGGTVYTIDFQRCSLEKSSQQEHDLEIESQPLWFAFKMPFGFQTLGVSGRYKLNDKYGSVPSTWKIVRIISSLENAEIYLSPLGLLRPTTLSWLWNRRLGLTNQVLQQIGRFSSK